MSNRVGILCQTCDFAAMTMSEFDAHDCPEYATTSGYCEDYPCCGHEAGDCFGQKYGSDESIKAHAYRVMELEDQGIFVDDFYY